jgi:asparagine synthase (glutamine-hydrolysing)
VCGILGLAGTAPLPESLLDAVGLLAHRGPDGEGRFVDGGIGLAMRRLAIIDLETGDQPIANETGDVVLVCNGEIYNYVELRHELEGRGHRFSTSGDVETIVHLYEELGEGCFERLRGMFGCALWDAKRRRLVVARDRFGIKPVYVAEVGEGRLGVCSEIAPLLALGASRSVDLQAVADFLTLGYVPGEATGLSGVRALAPGHALVWEDGAVREVPFAGLEARAGEDLEAVLAEAVRVHLRADVPLAVLLSGGLDSSLIAALAAREEGAGLHTFTVGFGDPQFDEREPARVVARAIGSEHHEVSVAPAVADDLPAILRALDEPLGDPSAIPLWYVCRATAREVKVALAGEGGDEVFGGYSRYAWDRVAALAGRLPVGLLADGLERIPGVAGRAGRGGRKDVVRRAVKFLRHAELPEAERYCSWFALVSAEAKAELVAQAAVAPAARVYAAALAAAPPGVSALGRLQAADLRTMLLGDLMLKADRMSMASSLELRVPLLDNEVVAAGLGLADRRKVRGVRTKVALREIVAARLPEAIAKRPKQGFEVPIDRWLREELAPLARDLLAPERVRARGLFDPAAVGRLLSRHQSGASRHGLALYGLLALELWQEQVVDAIPARPAA